MHGIAKAALVPIDIFEHEEWLKTIENEVLDPAISGGISPRIFCFLLVTALL